MRRNANPIMVNFENIVLCERTFKTVIPVLSSFFVLQCFVYEIRSSRYFFGLITSIKLNSTMIRCSAPVIYVLTEKN